MKLVDCMDFEAVFNSLPAPTMVMDADLNIVAANRAYLDVTGRDSASLIGVNVFEAFPGEGPSRVKLQKSFERVRDEGVVDVMPSLDYPIAGAYGVEPRRWTCTHTPIHGADGKVAYIVQNTRDISALAPPAGPQPGPGATGATSAQRLEMAQVLNQTLLTTAHYLHRLFMHASNFMCVLRGRDYVYDMVNKSYAEFIGGRDVVGKRMRDVLPELASQGFMDVLDKVYNSGEAFAGRKMRILLQGGDGQIREYFIDLTCQPILGEDGEVSGIFIEGSDVTNMVRADQRQALLIRELHHRVRNTLATVQGVMNTTAKSSATIEEFQEAFAGRIGSLAKTHAVMTDELDQCVSFEHLLIQELGLYAGNGRNRVHLKGPPVELPSQIAVPLGMAVHELTTNAVKFGSLAFESGHVAVEWSLAEGPAGAALRWEWSESDGPRVAPPGREGFGSMLLKRVLSQQIGAEVNVAFEPEGFRLRMLVPLRAER
ncbi:signal transduction histidine kinase [Methylocella silvestris BL2]|uniref:Blue-light-activated histidine kinase n=1 Tax=Methylocella silvestris (strain DSM 15510 / CIP 108128 / LMG 27833 / NCIMB 13906 / BL2) TaxID=395965 RepID=B8ESM0_METSB|nr:PAS domain-containing protein [Methylocella silvestris]ACK50355.1 signal transduction histidine kinase [Methylocella silvestris BL2]